MSKFMSAINITNINGIADRSAGLRHGLGASRHRATRVLTMLKTMSDRSHQRRGLAALDDRQLRDIGCSRAQARAEAAKPFWRA